MNSYSVSLKKIVEDFHLTVVNASSDFDTVQVMVEEIARPGLQLSGFFNHFERMRLQIIGKVESAYINTLSHERLLTAFDELFSYKIPAMIFARNIEPKPINPLTHATATPTATTIAQKRLPG